MIDRKPFSSLAWDVSESEYRADPALSYSTLAKYEREGFEHLDTLFDKVESPSLLLGSCVDTLLTDGEEAFNEAYYVSDIPSMEPKVEPVVKEVYRQFKDSYTSITDIPDSKMLPIIEAFKYQPNWRSDTRCRVIREKGYKYYTTMFMAKGKTILTQNTYNKAFACVRALKDSEATSEYFAKNDPFSNIERYYQLKFKGTLNGIEYRCMADLIIVDHDRKVVYPCDLKTSSHMEYDFPKSFIQWNYSVQARLYWRLIRQAMDKDEVYKDYTLADYTFIVVNTIDTPNPLTWTFSHTKDKGTITLGNNKLRDPEDIGEELHFYLNEKPIIPKGILPNQPNSIETWFEEHEQ
jgi:hypothetical protein